MTDIELIAGVLYTEYCAKVGGLAFNGDKLPTWEEFRADPAKKKQSDAWVAVAVKSAGVLLSEVEAFLEALRRSSNSQYRIENDGAFEDQTGGYMWVNMRDLERVSTVVQRARFGK